MKQLLIFGLMFLALTNAMYIYSTSDTNLNILNNAQLLTDDSYGFDEKNALDKLLKGILKGAGVTIVGDSTACLTGEGAISLFEYYYGLFIAAGSSGRNSGVDSMRVYLNSAGYRRVKSIPSDLMNCLTNSQDFKNLQAKFKQNPAGDIFGTAFGNYAAGNTVYFQISFSEIYAATMVGDFERAGIQFGQYARNVALRFSKNQ